VTKLRPMLKLKRWKISSKYRVFFLFGNGFDSVSWLRFTSDFDRNRMWDGARRWSWSRFQIKRKHPVDQFKSKTLLLHTDSTRSDEVMVLDTHSIAPRLPCGVRGRWRESVDE